ncbi:MAG TPA: thioredoxin fold domain-containing protein [Chthonomonadaceae bacterium]|nr:thioredoxin fold domain-containing protein [Chthonomonadaceae bacterium]
MQSKRSRKRWLLLLAFWLGVGVLGAVRESRIAPEMAWAGSYEAGLAQASQLGKPLLLSVHTPGCGWCQKLDAETFTDPKVIELSRRYVCVRLDSDVDTAIVERYHVLDYPTTIFADSQGKELARLPGYIPPDRFAQALRLALEAAGAKRP